MDLITAAKMKSEEVEALARQVRLKCYRACVKENLNVDKGTMEVYKLPNWKLPAFARQPASHQ